MDAEWRFPGILRRGLKYQFGWGVASMYHNCSWRWGINSWQEEIKLFSCQKQGVTSAVRFHTIIPLCGMIRIQNMAMAMMNVNDSSSADFSTDGRLSHGSSLRASSVRPMFACKCIEYSSQQKEYDDDFQKATLFQILRFCLSYLWGRNEWRGRVGVAPNVIYIYICVGHLQREAFLFIQMMWSWNTTILTGVYHIWDG